MALVAHETFRREHSYSQKNNCYQPLWYAGFCVQITGQLNVPWVNDRRLTSSLYSHSYRLFIVKEASEFSLSPVSLQDMKTRNEEATVKIGLLIPWRILLPEVPQLPNNCFAFHGTRRFERCKVCHGVFTFPQAEPLPGQALPYPLLHVY